MTKHDFPNKSEELLVYKSTSQGKPIVSNGQKKGGLSAVFCYAASIKAAKCTHVLIGFIYYTGNIQALFGWECF